MADDKLSPEQYKESARKLGEIIDAAVARSSAGIGNASEPIPPIKYLSNRIDANDSKIDNLERALKEKFEKIVYPLYGAVLLLALGLWFK